MANELFDAVLTGSVDQDKKLTTKVAPPNVAPSKEKLHAVKRDASGNSTGKLSIYIGNFPWVSILLSLLSLVLFYDFVEYTQFK